MSDTAPRQLILTLYGLYARDERHWLSVGSVVRLLGDLGVDSAGVRSSISRLKRRGVLQAVKVGSAAGYALSGDSVEIIREGDVRIFDRRRASMTDGLLLVVYSVPEHERDKRHQLRMTLTRMGLGAAAPGVWVAPGQLHDEIHRTLERLEMTPYVNLFRSRYEGFAALEDRVAQWWDLDAIDLEYRHFVERYRGAHARWKAADDPLRTAFEIYVPMLTEWRRLPYLDPGLPLDLLPRGWSGTTAADLFHDLDALLRTDARQHAMIAVHA